MMSKTLWVLAVVQSIHVVPSSGLPDCEPPAPLCPNPNEVYDPCLSECPPRYCGVDISAISCSMPADCVPGCRCRDGALRNGDGVCVPEQDCPKCEKPNEVYDVCPVKCPPQECGVDASLIRCKSPPEPGSPDCEPGCRCRYGYLRNKRGVCIPADKCPPKCGKHEVYSECPAAECRPLNCSQVGTGKVPCINITDCPCPVKPACVCKENYARNSHGVCVPWGKCPSCNGDPNAESGCGNCGRHCSDTGKPPVACAAVCKYNDCTCRPGLVYDDNTKKCVRPKDCTPTCKKNEVYSDCISPCNLQNCSQLGYPIPCESSTDITVHCKAGCTCRDGYLRAKNGTCIPIDCCPSCGGDPNAESGCGNCGKHCSDIGKPPVACAAVCKYNDCTCRPGLVYDDNTKKCVRPKDCTPTCKKNEVYSDCISPCNLQNCSQLGYPIPCESSTDITVHCKAGCTCRDGYLRAENETCIPIDCCPSCGGDPNAVSGCGNCGKHCSDIGKPPVACALGCKYNDCTCRPGLVYDDNTKKCVRPKDCTPTCKKNEVYSDCISPCNLQNCSQLGYPIPCESSTDITVHCKGGCTCRDGYLRAENGTCIPIDCCPSCGGDPNAKSGCGNCGKHCSDIGKPPVACALGCKYNDCTCKDGLVYDDNTKKCVKPKDCINCTGPNEYFACGGACDNVCATLHIQNQTDCPIINKKCNPMCYCKEGCARDKNGICLPIEQCPPVCKINEVYSDCINGGCVAKNCSQLGQPIPCVKIDPKYCIKGCLCKEGYLRNKNGICIPKEKCEPTCPINQVYDSCVNGGCRRRRCSDPGILCIDPIKCESGCRCKDEYVLNDNGVCIPVEDCTPKCHGAHEVYDPCAQTCPPQTCESINRTYHCPIKPAVCKGDCVCEKSYLRNKMGECILRENCLKCVGPNEYFSCGGACDNVCATLHEQNQTNCPIVNIKCNEKCYCLKDYARDENGICIPISDCPVCPANEVYDSCANGGCSKRNCSQIDDPEKCIRPKKCIGGCVCKEGYLRNNKGVCVPIDKCPRKCNRTNEYYDPCPPHCPPQTCESIGQKYFCPAIKPGNCKGECRCKEGYLRNKKGECILESDCLKCLGPNEYFSCGGACDNVCATLHKQNQTNCPIVNIKCNEMCYCLKDYARDKNGTCIPITDCPEYPCAKNEHYEECPSECEPHNCSQLGFPIMCPATIDGRNCGSPGCVCDDGYVWNDCGVCIPRTDCPSCGGDPNAVSGSGNHCGNRCSDYTKGPIPCPLFIIFNGCSCRKGHVFDDNTGKCVLPKNCTEICGVNQVYDTCVNGGCRKRYCSDIGGPILCIDPIECLGGCRCRDGYLLNKKGVCVPIDECPKPTCPKNEIYDMCANGGCTKRKCSDLDQPTICIDPLECIGDCVCVDGYLRNADGVCIPEKDCPHICNKPHEVYDPCPSSTPQTCDSLDLPTPDCNCRSKCSCDHECHCKDCKGACVCEKGYYRNYANECISKEECRKCKGRNEFFSCRAPCDNECETLHEQNQTSCPLDSIECKCYCIEGTARDSRDICIPIEDCPDPRCGPNERYEENPTTYCEPLDCSELGFPIDCPILNPGCEVPPICVCKFGYVRNHRGICIPKSKCPSCGGDPNAVSGCGNKCGHSCSDYNRPVVCTQMCYPNGCDCRKGFVYDEETKLCVRPEDCSTQTTHPPPTLNNTEIEERLNTGSIALTGEFVYQLLSANPVTSFVASCTSLLIPLAQIAYFATGSVLDELLRLLNLRSPAEIKSVFPGVVTNYEIQKDVVFSLATKYYVNIKYPLSKNFTEFSLATVHATGENIDFAKNVPAANTINSWVETKTNNKIKDLVSPDMFSADTRLVCVNAIYFLGNWIHQFNENRTEVEDFYLDDTNTIKLPIMKQNDKSFNYYEDSDLKIQALEMLYKGGNFSFLVVLPNEKGVEAVRLVAGHLRNPDNFKKIVNNMSSQKVILSLPKLRLETRSDMAEMLKKANVTKMFDPHSDGFKGILENPEPIYVSDIVQKAFIEVNEKGTEAAAATAIMVGVTSAAFPPPKKYVFDATHAFLYYILLNGDPLFCGAFIGI